MHSPKLPRADSPDEALWDTKQTAAYLGLSVNHVRRMYKENRIPFVRVGISSGSVKFEPAKIRAWVAARSQEAVT